MTGNIASHLTSLLPLDTKIIAWDQIDKGEQRKIENAITGNPPDCLVYPHTALALSHLVQTANEHGWSLLPFGNGSKLDWGGLVKSPRIGVSLGQIDRIIDHAVGDLTVTVEAGVTLANLQKHLYPSRQFLPLDPSYPDTATIGGIMATADAGSWRQRYGGVRDMILGFSFVRHDGFIAKAGGRVVKNVAGYDMMKLFTGSYGTLGIITEVTLRLYPMTDASETLLITGNGENIAQLSHTIRQSALTPTVAEFLTSAMVRELDLGEKMGLLLRFESIPESIIAQSQQITDLAQSLNCEVYHYSKTSETDLWQRYQKTISYPSIEGANFCKIGIIPSAIESIVQAINTLTQNTALVTINISSGIGKLILPSEEKIEKIRSLCQSQQGYLTLLSSSKALKEKLEPWGYTGNAFGIMEKLKNTFDPKSIFSPERFINKL